MEKTVCKGRTLNGWTCGSLRIERWPKKKPKQYRRETKSGCSGQLKQFLKPTGRTMTHIVTLQLTLTQPKVILTREIVWTIPLSFEGNKDGGGAPWMRVLLGWLLSNHQVINRRAEMKRGILPVSHKVKDRRKDNGFEVNMMRTSFNLG